MKSIREALAERVLLLDGAMGTEILARGLSEADFRGERFKEHTVDLKGDNDVLLLTRPDIIAEIHDSYLRSGADIIETCTFNSQRLSQAEYGLEAHVAELNRRGAEIAVEAARRWSTPERPRYVGGSVGPTGKMLSMAGCEVSFDDMVSALGEQMEALIEGGVDLLLVETLFDPLNAKAAIIAAREAMAAAGREVELMLSATVADASGRLLSGQTVEAFAVTVAHARPLSIGLNCSTGASDLLPALRRLAAVAPCYVSCHPNAGLPDRLGRYADTPENMACQVRPMLTEGLVNIVGGCCGTTPPHIAALRQLLDGEAFTPRTPRAADARLRLAGLEPLVVEHTFVNVGERCNVAGSRKFLRLISEAAIEEASAIAAGQVEDGAMVLDINMDDGMLDAPREMERFLVAIGSDPSVARVPVMIDSSRFDVIEAALRRVQGKPVVNSLSLKEGEAEFLRRAAIVRSFGAAVVVMAFDEEGQATTLKRRIDICRRAYRLLVDKAGFDPADIIFDPNILTVATGMAEHLDYASDFVAAARWIHRNLSGARVSGGISNLSFAFRGNNYLREAMHAVFLYMAVNNGLDMAILNPGQQVTYEAVPEALREALEAVLFTERTLEATERLMELAAQYQGVKIADVEGADSAAELPLRERLVRALVKGSTAGLEEDLLLALSEIGAPVDIISGPLMEGMDTVGRLFGEGKMFLPQVVKTARTMKTAVDLLTPYMKGVEGEAVARRGRMLLATVKGDVHDIGKNIVGVVLECNNYEVVDLGVMVPPERIVEEARRLRPDFVCLSGLITPSLDEMGRVVEMMAREGLQIPVMIGGATTSALHTAVKIAPLYPQGVVMHVRDASQNPLIAARWLDPAQRPALVAEVRAEQERLRATLSDDEPTAERPVVTFDHEPFVPPFMGVRRHDLMTVSSLRDRIDWGFFYHAWRVPPTSPEAAKLRAEAEALLDALSSDAGMGIEALTGFYHAVPDGDSIRLDGTFISAPRRRGISIADWVNPAGDIVGAFAAAVSPAYAARLEALKAEDDTYGALLMQTLGDRLAAAASVALHDEIGSHGIRPAFGYPSLADQRAIFALDTLLRLSDIGITLTENGAMAPASSVAGVYVLHPEARYV